MHTQHVRHEGFVTAEKQQRTAVKANKTIALALLTIASLLLNGSTPPGTGLLERELAELTKRGLTYRIVDYTDCSTCGKGQRVEAYDPRTAMTNRFPLDPLLTPRQATYTGLPTLTIDLTTIDTSLYSWKFHYVNSIALTGGWGFPLEVSDFDRNGRAEAYGAQQTQSDYSTRAYEVTQAGDWSVRYIYPGRYGTIDKSGDIDGNGLREVYARYGDSLFAFEQPAINSIPIDSKFRHMQWYGNATGIPNQVDFMTGGLQAEIVYRGAEPVTSEEGVYVVRYDSIMNNLRRIWSVHIPIGCSGEDCPGAIATGDFDGDGRKELVTSTLSGNVYVMEHAIDDSFAVTWSTNLSAAGRAAAGDVDGNGVTEFFVGGTQAEADGYVHLRAYAFERTSDNTYQPTFAFNIFPAGIFFVDLYQTADVDGDGVPELLLSFAGGIAIFKGAGEHNYQLFYHKFVSSLDGLSAWKIGGNRAAHLFVSRFITGQPIITQTDVYRIDSALVVSTNANAELPTKLRLFPNYPNPFNPETTIEYELDGQGRVILTILTIIGEEVIILIDEIQHSGRYRAVWNPRDQGVASGLYLVRLTTNKQSLTIKMLYLK